MSPLTPIAVSTLAVRDLTVALPAHADRACAVSGVSFDVPRGQLVCLVGESGSGKSVIAHTVMGLLPPGVRPIGGSVRLLDEDVLTATPARVRQLRGARMGMIFQEPMTALNPVMSCGHQVDEVLACHTDLPARARRTRVLEMLARVQLPDPAGLYGAYPHQLSGGQRQRVMIAIALLLKPSLLIADEPTTALDVTTQAEVLRLIRELQREHDTAVLFITHDFGVVSEIADSVVVLRRGEQVESGPRRDVLSHPQHDYTKMLLASVPSLTPKSGATGGTSVLPGPSFRPVHLALRNLSKVFDDGGWFRKGRRVTAADAVTLEVRRGETVAIVGESGSGKSTVARLVARLIEPSSGEIVLDGIDVTAVRGAAARAFRRKVQVVFQDPFRSLNPRRTVGAAIAEGPINFGASRERARARATELMTLVGLPPDALGRYPHEFSGGQRQRICIARALAVGPEVLIADEAVSALDVSVQAQVLALLADLQRRLNLTLIFITHDLRVAAQVADGVVVMQRGRVVEQGRAEVVFLSPQHEYTRALLAAAPGRDFVFARPADLR